MYYIKKTFKLPIAHRLMKNEDRCFHLHGHTFRIDVEVKSEKLDSNDMVIDFSCLKEIVNVDLDRFDHGLMINKEDFENVNKMSDRIIIFDSDPTAEVLSKYLFEVIRKELSIWEGCEHVTLVSVTVFENEDSSATYREE